MLDIKLNDRYVLRSDPLNVWIEETIVSENGNPYTKVMSGYHPDIEGALLAYKRRKINSLEAHTIDELLQGISNTNEEIKEFCGSIKGAIRCQNT